MLKTTAVDHLELVVHRGLHVPAVAQVFHAHDHNDERGPACEMLRPLASSSIGIVLLPSESSLLPRLIHCIYQIMAELGVQLTSFCL